MSIHVLPRPDFSFGRGTLGCHFDFCRGWCLVRGARPASIAAVVLLNRSLPALHESMDAGANASVLPTLTVASLVGFGAVVAGLPAFATVL
jgi:hypothetical protein